MGNSRSSLICQKLNISLCVCGFVLFHFISFWVIYFRKTFTLSESCKPITSVLEVIKQNKTYNIAISGQETIALDEGDMAYDG